MTGRRPGAVHGAPAVVALGLSLVVAGAEARTFQGEYVAFGVGTQPCVDYTAARAQEGEMMERVSGFIEGYLTAFNVIVPDTYDILAQAPTSVVIEWLDDHCLANPAQSLTDALAAFTVVRYPDRANMNPATAPSEAESRSTTPSAGD
ncbi:MAG: hypothetical protein ACLFSG_09580 [Halothiobacillaceae bacterium]